MKISYYYGGAFDKTPIAKDINDISETYQTKEKVNKLLNDTYVAMEKAEEVLI